MRCAHRLFALPVMVPLVSAAAPGSHPTQLMHTKWQLIDRDGDGISVGLPAELEEVGPGDRGRLAVTLNRSRNDAQRRTAAGAFEHKLSIAATRSCGSASAKEPRLHRRRAVAGATILCDRECGTRRCRLGRGATSAQWATTIL